MTSLIKSGSSTYTSERKADLNKAKLEPSKKTSGLQAVLNRKPTPVLNRVSTQRTSSSSKSPFSMAGRKLARSNLAKTPEDLMDEIKDLRKNVNTLSDENMVLRTKLRHLDEESNRRTEAEKTAAHSAMNTMKKRLEKMEQNLKDKDSKIRKLQDCLKNASQSDPKLKLHHENKPLSPHKESTSPSPSRQTSSRGGRLYSTSDRVVLQNRELQAENLKLKQQLRRALDVDEDKTREYDELSQYELIAYIIRLNQDIEDLKRNEKKSVPIDCDKSVESLHKELESMKAELRLLKADRLSYFLALEEKEEEVKTLKQEVEKLHKDLLNVQEKERARHIPSPKRPLEKYSLHAYQSKKPTAGMSEMTGAKSKVPTARPVTLQSSQVSKKVTTLITETKKSTVSKTKTVATGHSKMSNTASTKTLPFPKKPKAVEKPAPISKPLPNLKDEEVVGIAEDGPSEQAVQEIRENLAAKKIQRTWRQHNAKVNLQESLNDSQAEKVENFRNERAARVIQKGWRHHHQQKELDEMAVAIQSTVRAHTSRLQQVENLESEQNDEAAHSITDDDNSGVGSPVNVSTPTYSTSSHLIAKNLFGDSANVEADNGATENGADMDDIGTVIQSFARGHHTRERQLKDLEMNGQQANDA